MVSSFKIRASMLIVMNGLREHVCEYLVEPITRAWPEWVCGLVSIVWICQRATPSGINAETCGYSSTSDTDSIENYCYEVELRK